MEILYPPRRMPEHHYSPEAEDFSRITKVMEEVLSFTQEALIKFQLSLSAPDQLIVSQFARSAFLKDPEAWKAHYCVPGQDDQEEEEEEAKEDTVVNGENNGDCEEVLQDQEDNNFIPMPPRSPRNSIESSKSVRI